MRSESACIGALVVTGAAAALAYYTQPLHSTQVAQRLVDTVDHVDQHLDDEDQVPDHQLDPTAFQRYVLAIFKTRYGTLTYNAANMVLARRELRVILRAEREDMRARDVEWHITRLVALVFIPTTDEVEMSRVLARPAQGSNLATRIASRVWRWFAPNPVATRVESLVLPPQ
jgi:hypothetical protein